MFIVNRDILNEIILWLNQGEKDILSIIFPIRLINHHFRDIIDNNNMLFYPYFLKLLDETDSTESLEKYNLYGGGFRVIMKIYVERFMIMNEINFLEYKEKGVNSLTSVINLLSERQEIKNKKKKIVEEIRNVETVLIDLKSNKDRIHRQLSILSDKIDTELDNFNRRKGYLASIDKYGDDLKLNQKLMVIDTDADIWKEFKSRAESMININIGKRACLKVGAIHGERVKIVNRARMGEEPRATFIGVCEKSILWFIRDGEKGVCYWADLTHVREL